MNKFDWLDGMNKAFHFYSFDPSQENKFFHEKRKSYKATDYEAHPSLDIENTLKFS